MDPSLNLAMQSLNLEEDVPIDIPADGAYSAVERSSMSLIGRLLNPEVQNMARMLRSMPRIWKIYERVRGIGLWTFDEWGMVLEQWMENPRADFLKKASVWIKLHKIAVNYFTLETIGIVANRIGHVQRLLMTQQNLCFKPRVRVRVAINLEDPVRDIKSLNLLGGGVAIVEVEYERRCKKCFNCFRLTHKKQRCPLLQRNKPEDRSPSMLRTPHSEIRQHHTNLSDQILPLLAPSFPPDFSPQPNLVASEVFEHMRIYMSSGDPKEHCLREQKMKKTLDELSKDPIAQRSYLRLEAPPVFTVTPNDTTQVAYATVEVSPCLSPSRSAASVLSNAVRLEHSSSVTVNANENQASVVPPSNINDAMRNDPLITVSATPPSIIKELEASNAANENDQHMGSPIQEESDSFIPPDLTGGFTIGCAKPSSSSTSSR
ncbi:hypothetical protein EUTSA_v10003091mg, partial [Eutrema salsugineum]